MGRRRRHHRCRFLPVGAVFGGLCCLMLVLARLPRRSMLYLLADSSLARLALAAGCHGGSVIVLLWRLCFVGVLLGGASKSIARWCFHRYCHSPGFLPLDGVGWLYVEPGWAVGVTINFKGDRRVRQIVVCVSFTSLSPHFIGWSLRWRAAVERRSYEERCRDALVIV